MTPHQGLLPLISAALLSAVVVAQSSLGNEGGKSNPRVWAAVGFVNHGETTPFLGSRQPILTPEGAQQMSRQGTAFRKRYLSSNIDSSNTSTTMRIQGLSRDIIDNTQISLFSQTDPWVFGGAVAFLQGLYPPTTNMTNGDDLARNLPLGTNGSSYPLNGYQYPNIQTVASTDSRSISIEGNAACAAWQNTIPNSITTNTDLQDKYKKNAEFYQKLFSEEPLRGQVSSSQANFYNAYELYQLVQYQYIHNETVFKGLSNAPNTLETLKNNALQIEHARAGNDDGTSKDPSAVLHGIAGRTLASKVIFQMSSFVNKTSAEKLTLLFGSSGPLVSFLAVGGLLTRDNLLSSPIGNLTRPGASLVFELIGDSPDKSNAMPPIDGLKVRFLYRAGSNDNDTFEVYPLFGSGFDGQTIPYSSFFNEMNRRGRDATDWCNICQPAASILWCAGLVQSHLGENNPSSAHMIPALAGVIGALIMGAIVAAIGLGLFYCGGFRFLRRRRGDRDHPGAGGFKGPEKRPADADIDISKQGTPQERIGSWEMTGAEQDNQGTRALGVVTSDYLGTKRIVGHHHSDDGSSIHYATPVNARENV